jgi:hypothetical protein
LLERKRLLRLAPDFEIPVDPTAEAEILAEALAGSAEIEAP